MALFANPEFDPVIYLTLTNSLSSLLTLLENSAVSLTYKPITFVSASKKTYLPYYTPTVPPQLIYLEAEMSCPTSTSMFYKSVQGTPDGNTIKINNYYKCINSCPNNCIVCTETILNAIVCLIP